MSERTPSPADGPDPITTGDGHEPAPSDIADTLNGHLDTAALRNLVQARVFGAVPDPVRIGRFPILRRLGRGAMGVVYSAYDNELDRKIALKLLHAVAGHDAASMRNRLLREAKALGRLSHPGVVQIYEVGEHDGRVFLAMEFVSGDTVRTWSTAQARSTAEILEVFAQAGRGLAAAHDAGLVHRDVKPENIVVGHDGRVRVVDFGLAVDHGEGSPATPERDDEPIAAPLDRWTRTNAMAGTPAYMASEQFMGGAADARSDQFGFAVSLFETLFGHRPFEGTTLGELSAAVAIADVKVPSHRRVPPHVAAALRRALSADPERRFDSMQSLLDAITRTPAKRLRWGVVLGVSTVSLVGIVGLIMILAPGNMIDAYVAQAARADKATQQAEAALIAEARATLTTDPNAALEQLAKVPMQSQAWSETAWPLAQGAADAGLAVEILALPADAIGTRFGRDGTPLVTVGGETRALDVASGALLPMPATTGAGAPVLGVDAARGRSFVHTDDGAAMIDRDGTRRAWTIAGDVTSVAASPDGRTLVVGSRGGGLSWIDLDDAAAAPTRGVGPQGDGIASLAWSPDGQDVAALSIHGVVQLWDALGRRVRMTVRSPEPIRGAKWHADGTLETLAPSSWRRWRIAGARTLSHGTAGFAACGEDVVVAGTDGHIVRWHDGAPSVLTTVAPDAKRFAMTPDCETAAIAWDHRWEVVTLATGERRHAHDTKDRVAQLALSNDRLSWVDACRLHSLVLDGGETRELAAASSCFDGLVITGDDVMLAEGPKDGGVEGIRTFALADGTPRDGLDPSIRAWIVAPIPGTQQIAFANGAGVATFDPTTGERRALSKPSDLVIALAASPDGAWLAALPYRAPIRVWHLATGMEYDLPFALEAIDPEGLTADALGPLRFVGTNRVAVVDLHRDLHVMELAVPTDAKGLRRWVMNAIPEPPPSYPPPT